MLCQLPKSNRTSTLLPSSTLCRSLSLAPTLADALGARVELIDGLIDARAFDAPASKAALLDEWTPALAGLGYERLLDRVRDRVGERRFAYGVQLIAGATDPLVVARGYSELAEAALQMLADATVAEFVVTHRSEEHTSELQSLMRISYAVFCLKQTKTKSTAYIPT